MNDPQREHAARPRIAYLSFSTGEYDARTFRMAKSAVAATAAAFHDDGSRAIAAR